jgi:hypothetical protein
LGLAERIESNWDKVGMGDRRQFVSEREVRDVVRDSNKSHDEMLHSKRWRRRNLGKLYREKKSETSTMSDLPRFRNMNDTGPFDWGPSLLVIMEEMTEVEEFRAVTLEMNPSYGASCSTILESVAQHAIQIAARAHRQHQIEWSGSMTSVLTCPI